MRTLVLLSGLVAAAFLAHTPRLAADDKDSIQGKWKITKVELPPDLAEAQGFIDSVVKDIEISVKDDLLQATLPGEKEPGKARFTLDPSKTPKQIDVVEVVEKGKDVKPKPARGIYKLEGDTAVVVIPTGDDVARPTEFKAVGKKGDKNVTIVIHLKKVK